MTAAASPSRTYPFLLGGELRSGADSVEIRSPYSRDLIGRAALAGPSDVAAALDAAVAAGARGGRAAVARPGRRARPNRRRLWRTAGRRWRISSPSEAGKPLALARTEIDRAVFVFRQGAEEAMRMGGEVIPMDLQPHGERRWGITRRFPLSPISAIIPFNFPVLLAAHKLAPAIACGATMVLKPPPQDPLATLLLAEIVRESGYPAGALSILLCSNEVAAPLIDDPRVRHDHLHRLGPRRVGHPAAARPTKRVTLELGGNAAVMIEPDADLEHAVRRCVAGGYLYAGQSCISTQRILVHEALYHAFTERFVAAVGGAPHRRPDGRDDRGRPDDRPGQRRAGRRVDRRGGRRRGHGGGGGPADRRDPRARGAARHHRRHARQLRGDLRARHHRPPVRRLRGGHRRGQRLALRPPGRALHQRHAADPPRVRAGRGGRAGGQRCARASGWTTRPTAGSRHRGRVAKAFATPSRR